MWVSSFPREVLNLYLRLPSVLTPPSPTDSPGHSPCTRLQSCTIPNWSRRWCWFSVKQQRQKWDRSHQAQKANCSQVQQGTPALPHEDGGPQAVGSSGTSRRRTALLTFLPPSLQPKLQTEFSLSLQIDLGSMKSHFPPKLVFTRIFLSFFADNYDSIGNRKKKYWSSVKERAVRVIRKKQDEQVSKGRLKRTSCATSGMMWHLFLGFLLLLLAKWLIGRIQFVQSLSGATD